MFHFWDITRCSGKSAEVSEEHTASSLPVQTEVNKQHGGHKDNTNILTNNKHTISRSTWLAHGWQHHIGKNWHNRAPASGEYTITPEDGRVRPIHVDE
jgi:hypothetical protein